MLIDSGLSRLCEMVPEEVWVMFDHNYGSDFPVTLMLSVKKANEILRKGRKLSDPFQYYDQSDYTNCKEV